ncbi:MAG: NAD-binding protein, partial [Flavobacteriaceae bacterium]|nr:NAD-binding protein [Flavobacteriaceae bacterium]
FVSTIGSSLKFNEKLFISWVGPRGIVAAGIASLFGTKLALKGFVGAEYITPLVFAVVLVTVLLNATTARFFASIVGVFLKTSEGILIVGASKVSRLIANYLQKNGRHVVLVDSNQANVNQAEELGLEAFTANIYAADLAADIELSDVGYLLALTGSEEVNRQAINRFGKIFGETGIFRLMTPEEKEGLVEADSKALFSNTHDFAMLEEVARLYPSIQEVPLQSKEQFLKLLSIIEKDDSTVALFLKLPSGYLEIINTPKEMEVGEKYQLVYLGKPFDIEELNSATRNQRTSKK